MLKTDVLSVYSSGLCELVLAALGAAAAVLLTFSLVGFVFGIPVDADAVLLFSWQIVIFCALWPGQTFWTIRRTTSSGRVHSIIGVPSDDDLRDLNHRRARLIRGAMRD